MVVDGVEGLEQLLVGEGFEQVYEHESDSSGTYFLWAQKNTGFLVSFEVEDVNFRDGRLHCQLKLPDSELSEDEEQRLRALYGDRFPKISFPNGDGTSCLAISKEFDDNLLTQLNVLLGFDTMMPWRENGQRILFSSLETSNSTDFNERAKSLPCDVKRIFNIGYKQIHSVTFPESFRKKLWKLMNSDVEHSLCFLASDFDGHLEITNMQSSQGNADTCSIFRPSDWFLERAKDNRTLLSGHVHYTKNGTVIEDAMPYWTLPQGLGYVPRVIINDEFFVGRKQTMRGDTEALLGMSTYFWDCFKIENRLTIFVHPQYDSHGGLMSPNLMQVSCYELDPLAKFGVRPIEVNFG